MQSSDTILSSSQSQNDFSSDDIDSNMEFCGEKHNHTVTHVNGKNDVYVASSLGHWKAHWMPETHTWLYTFKMAGIASSSGPTNMIRAAAFQIEGKSNTEHLIIDPIEHSRYIWCTPMSNTSNNTSKVSSLLVSTVMAVICNQGASIAWSLVSELINSLGNGNNRSDTRDNYVWRLWDWNPDISNTSSHIYFRVEVDPNETVSFSTEYKIFGLQYELLSAGKLIYTLTAPGSQNNSNPAQMTPEEREKCGILTISRDQIQTRAAELNLAEETINELLASDEREFYIATNEPILEKNQSVDETELNKSELTNKSMINAVSTQMERSEEIIKVFSGEKICDMEGSMEIVNKHTSKLASLKNMQTKLATIEESDMDELNVLYDQYINIIDDNLMA